MKIEIQIDYSGDLLNPISAATRFEGVWFVGCGNTEDEAIERVKDKLRKVINIVKRTIEVEL